MVKWHLSFSSIWIDIVKTMVYELFLAPLYMPMQVRSPKMAFVRRLFSQARIGLLKGDSR